MPVARVVLNAVFGLELGVMATCQYPFVRSSVEMTQALPRHLMKSFTQGMG